MRAYCVALSAAVTVIVASSLGLPVSSTHIAVGAVFGVGFFREYLSARQTRARCGPSENGSGNGSGGVYRRRKLVRRGHLMTIAAAWVITVPATAVMASALFFLIAAVQR
jgi:PiT family inorganic phosphate transporter